MTGSHPASNSQLPGFPGRTLILQKIQRIVLAGTPDLSGRMLNGAGSLPHECGVPPQCPVTPFFGSIHVSSCVNNLAWFMLAPLSRIRTIMKIKSINKELSDKRKVAFRTEPQIDAPTLEQIRRLLQQSLVLKGVGVELTEGCLVVIHPTFTPELARNVNDLLNAAENAVRLAKEDARKRAELEQTEKNNAIQSASSAFGVPIE